MRATSVSNRNAVCCDDVGPQRLKTMMKMKAEREREERQEERGRPERAERGEDREREEREERAEEKPERSGWTSLTERQSESVEEIRAAAASLELPAEARLTRHTHSLPYTPAHLQTC